MRFFRSEVKHGIEQLAKALSSVVTIVGSQASGKIKPLDAHQECDQTKLQAGNDVVRYSFNLAGIESIVPKEVVDKMMAKNTALKT